MHNNISNKKLRKLIKETLTKQDFGDWVKDKGEKEKMEELKMVAIEEGFFNEASLEYDKLFEKFKPSTERDLVKFKEQIRNILEDEIIGRYYYMEGRIEHSLIKDDFIEESVKILNDLSRYNQILNIQN